MNGRLGAWVACAISLAALVWQVQTGLERMEASRLLYQAEGLSMELIAVGQAPRAFLRQNLRNLRRAAELDPLEAAIPLALGSQFLLLRSPQAAADAYRQALVIEPRPEIYLNLGKAQHMAGHSEEARQNFERAVGLDWHFEAEVPAALTPSSGSPGSEDDLDRPQ